MKKHLIVVGIIFLFVGMGFQPAFANDNNISFGKMEQQPRGETFMKTFGGKGWDESSCVQQTTDGGYIITGSPRSFGSGFWDIWLIKTDSNGNKIWGKTFGGTGEEMGWYVQQTDEGGYIIIGNTWSFGAGEGDVWLIKTDIDGNKLWDKTYGKTGNDWGTSVQQTSDGGYILTGSIGGDLLFKTDNMGNLEWNVSFDEGFSNLCFCVQQTSDGGYIVTGSLWSFNDNNSDVLLIKTDNAGNIVWNRTFGGTNFDHGRFVRQTTDGEYILLGYTRSYGAGKSDFWLIKTDSSGNMVWNRTFGGVDYDNGYCVQQTSDGGYILTGRGGSLGIGGSVWLIKTDNTGNKIWDRIYGGISYDTGYFVQQTSDSGFIITGASASFNSDNGNMDFLLIKTDKDGNVKTKPVIGNMLLLRILERFPLLWRIVSRLNLR